MYMKKPVLDYRKIKLQTIFHGEFAHLKLLLYWPCFGLLFLFAERFYQVESYYAVSCPLDDKIPFCEWFLIPYLFWFVYLIGMHLYTLLYDITAFRNLMKYIMITYSITILIYLIFPTCQELRPVSFERDNPLTACISAFYAFDTNTNVCPSIHVIGSLAVMETALYAESIRSKRIKCVFVIAAILICVSTVFMKQHSLLDFLAALPVCLIAHVWCYGKNKKMK